MTDDVEFEKRDKHLEPIFKSFEGVLNIPDKTIRGVGKDINLKRMTFFMCLNGYLEDFMGVICCENRKKTRKSNEIIGK